MNSTAMIGHNRPPTLAEELAEKYAKHVSDVEQIAAYANETPRKIETDETLDRIGKLLVSVRGTASVIEADRKKEKQPYLDAGREVDGWFGGLTERLDRIKTVFQRIADDYAREKAAAERRAREEEARKLREAEEKKRAEAEAAKRAATQARRQEEADRLAERAEEAEAVAAAPAADLVRQRTASGTLATAATEWTFEVTSYVNVDLEVLRPYLKREAIDAAVRLAVKQGVREIRGVRVWEETRARFR